MTHAIGPTGTPRDLVELEFALRALWDLWSEPKARARRWCLPSSAQFGKVSRALALRSDLAHAALERTYRFLPARIGYHRPEFYELLCEQARFELRLLALPKE